MSCARSGYSVWTETLVNGGSLILGLTVVREGDDDLYGVATIQKVEVGQRASRGFRLIVLLGWLRASMVILAQIGG